MLSLSEFSDHRWLTFNQARALSGSIKKGERGSTIMLYSDVEDEATGKPFRIGNVEMDNRVVLAPMAGISNSAFRLTVKEFGAGLVYAEMISDKGIVQKNEKTLSMLYIDERENPLSLQIFGGEKETLVAAAKYGGEVWELGDEVIAGTALAVFLGHLFPIFLAFKGGKGVATSAGILLGLNPWLGVLTISTWMVVALVSRISSLSALLSALLAPLYAYFLLEKGILIMAVSIISVLLILKHRLNIANLMAGKEARIGKSS